MSAQLPDNYSAERSIPLFVYLGGGNGGHGDTVALARRIIGARDYIAVDLPLFKSPPKPNDPSLRGLTLDPANVHLPNDTAILSRCYRAMLQKLYETVPNITSGAVC
ncbi:MAG: hypothetical protein WDN28_03190 [Chthoniobacter sp.]